MFTVSQLHNAFWVVVQLERHCWLSLAAGIFLLHIERCCQKSVLLKTLQGPANKSPPPTHPARLPAPHPPTPASAPGAAGAGPDCWKAAQAAWLLSKPGHFGNCHTQRRPASLSLAWRGHLWGPGRVNTYDPRQTFTIPPGVQTRGRKKKQKKPESLTLQKQYDSASDELRGRGWEVQGGALWIKKRVAY